jgi:hypothetical protein
MTIEDIKVLFYTYELGLDELMVVVGETRAFISSGKITLVYPGQDAIEINSLRELASLLEIAELDLV